MFSFILMTSALPSRRGHYNFAAVVLHFQYSGEEDELPFSSSAGGRRSSCAAVRSGWTLDQKERCPEPIFRVPFHTRLQFPSTNT
ncbi:hypothetical protein MHYP_G00018020 [Metynnis hypsauchen]